MQLLFALFRKQRNDASSSVFDTAPNSTQNESQQPFTLDAYELESRNLYSASPVPVEFFEPVVDGEPSLSISDQVSFDHASSEDNPWTGLEQFVDTDPLMDLDPISNERLNPSEVIFIDGSVSELNLIIEDLNTSFPDSNVYVIDPEKDGIKQINFFLGQHEDVSAVHVVSHGSDGSVRLGNTLLSSNTLASYADEIAQLSSHLSTDADILFYGCNLTGSADGETLMESIGELTGADIAASDDLTGHESLGGDWDLEFQFGQIDATLIFSSELQQSWIGVLADPTITVTGDSTATNGQVYSLDVSVFDPDPNTISEWTVIWGDGNVSTYAESQLGTVTHTYAESGLYDILVSVTDETGTYHNSTAISTGGGLHFFDQDGTLINTITSNTEFPEEVVMGPDGLLYVSSFSASGEVRRYDATTGAFVDVYFTTQPSGGNGGATGLAFDDEGNLFVAYFDYDTGADDDSLLWKVTDKNTGTVFIDTTDLDGPTAVEFGPNGNLFIANWSDNTVKEFDVESGAFLGNFVASGDLMLPSSMVFVDSGELYVVNQAGSSQLDRFDASGNHQSSSSFTEITNFLRGISQGPDGNLYLTETDGANSKVHVIDPSGAGSYQGEFIGSGSPMDFPLNLLFTPEVQVTVSSSDISGRVIEDVDGDAQLEVGEGGVEDAKVFLYRDNGNGVLDVLDQYLGQTTTDADGNYEFSDLDSAESYWIVVDSKTVTPSTALANSGFSYETASTGVNEGDVWAEQTYGDGGAKYGGLQPGVSDDATTPFTSQHVSLVDFTSGNPTDVDFGFSFNVVTNTLAGGGQDDENRDLLLTTKNDRSVQGSLRQFITNANAISDGNEMRFVPGDASQTDGTDTWWRIDVSIELPEILDANTVIDGRAYDGSGRHNSNTTIHGQTVAVGTGADAVIGTGDEYVLTGVEGVELEIVSTGSIGNGLYIAAQDVEIGHLAIHGFGNNIHADEFGDNVYIHNNIIGSGANSFSLQSTVTDSNNGISVFRADNGIIERNLIGFVGGAGIRLRGSIGEDDGTNDWTVRHNELHANAQNSASKDGIDLVARGQRLLVEENLFTDNQGFGVDTFRTIGDHLIINNTFSGNGSGGQETGGLRLFGANSVIKNNVFNQNEGAGVIVVGETTTGFTIPASTGNEISQNAFFDNVGISIDLVGESVGSNIHLVGDGISENGIASNNLAGNDGFDHPEVDTAELIASNLHLSGTIDISKSYDRLEIYAANPGTGDSLGGIPYGEGETYLGFIDGSTLSPDSSGRFDAVLSIPSGGWPVAVNNGTEISLIAIEAVSNNTSEFSRTIAISHVPDVVASTITATEDQPYQFQVTDFSVVNDDYSSFTDFIIETQPSAGLLLLGGAPVANGTSISFTQIANGELTFEADPDANGTSWATFEFSADGVQPSNSTAAMTVDVSPVNDAPEASDDTVLMNEDGTFTSSLGVNDLLFNDSDIDGNSLTVNTTPVSAPTNGSLNLSADGTFTYSPDPNFNGMDSFVYEVSDGNGETAQATVHITVEPTDDAPVAVDDSFSVPEDGSYTSISGSNDLLLNDFDIDGDALSLISSSVTLPLNGTLSTNSDGTFTYTPNANFSGSDAFTYEITDGTGRSNQATVRITVTPTEDLPVAVDDFFTTNEDQSLTPILGIDDLLQNDFDLDGDSLSIDTVPVTGPANGTLVLNSNGTFTYTPNSDFFGSDSFVYRVNDGNGHATTATVHLTIAPVNDAPIAISDSFSTNEDTTYTSNAANGLLQNDIDIDSPITVNPTPINGPLNGVVSIASDGTFSYTPNVNFHGVDSFEYEVSDGMSTDTAIVTVTVNPQNDAPSATDDTFAVDEDTTYIADLAINGLLQNDSDIDGDSLQLVTAALAEPSHGTVLLNADGTFTYTPESNYFGNDSFTYEVRDGNGGSTQATVSIVVNPINDAPLVADNSYSGLSTDVITGQLLNGSSDIDGDQLTVIGVVSPPSIGTFLVQPDGTFEFTPDITFEGSIDIPVLVSDSNGATDVSIATIVVTSPPPLPPNEQSESPKTDGPANEPIDLPTQDPDDSEGALPPLVVLMRSSSPRAIAEKPSVLDILDSVREVSGDDLEKAGWILNPDTNEMIDIQRRRGGDKTAESGNFNPNRLFTSLDLFGSNIDNAIKKADFGFSASVISFSGVSIGVVSWVLRASGMAASMLANIPAWRSIDPLVVLGYAEDEEDDAAESVSDIVEGATVIEQKLTNHSCPTSSQDAQPRPTKES